MHSHCINSASCHIFANKKSLFPQGKQGFSVYYQSLFRFGQSRCGLLWGLTEQERLLQRVVWGAQGDPIMQEVTRILFPAVALFGIYVIFNGHLSPGGGFSGGAVLGGGLILCSLVVGQNRMNQVLGPRRNTKMTACCLLAYAAMKSYSFYTGANHVGWEIPKGTPGNLLSAGFILPLNICVGIIVAGTIFSFYMLFTQEEEA